MLTPEGRGVILGAMRHRKGKITTGGHSTVLPGLRDFLHQIESWPEVRTIKLGRIAHRAGGGPWGFRPTRLASVGTVVTGVVCEAASGGQLQVVVITSDDPQALWTRLGAATGFRRAPRLASKKMVAT